MPAAIRRCLASSSSIARNGIVLPERGLKASLDDIAKCAGVGSGTLYRHFPTREDLITAVFTERMTEHVAAVEAARAAADPWQGFAGYVATICRAQATDKGL